MPSSHQTTKPRIFVDSIEVLERTFHEFVPISKAMGVSVVEYTGDALSVSAPLSANRNHQHSAFGGSLFAIAALSGWGLIQMKLSELLLDCNTVVMGGDVAFHRPVYDDLLCTSRLPADADGIFETLTEAGRTATSLHSTYESNGKAAMILTGKYHLQLRTHGEP